jgi:hypothetical protein
MGRLAIPIVITTATLALDFNDPCTCKCKEEERFRITIGLLDMDSMCQVMHNRAPPESRNLIE